jgi:riboflavin synthase
MRYIAEKGSICIDGVSLTVNNVGENWFEVNIIPHTMEETIIKNYKTGSEVNLEVDLIARYLESLMADSKSSGISKETLLKHGFM